MAYTTFTQLSSLSENDPAGSLSMTKPPLYGRQKRSRPPTAAGRMNAAAGVAATTNQPAAFRQKVNSANQIAICTSSSDQIGRRTLRQLFQNNNNGGGDAALAYEVPIFQRRYCWTETQWHTLWMDATKRHAIKHSLGRLTCANKHGNNNNNNNNGDDVNGGNNQRSVIIDGQQRFTTTTLILAAIRDVLIELSPDRADNESGDEDGDALLKSIHRMLFLSVGAMEDWTDEEGNEIAEGIELEFCRLIPTFSDRSAYAAAVLPPRSKQALRFVANDFNPRWHRPLVAKQYFARKIREYLSASPSLPPRDALQKLTRSLLDGVDMLYFPIDVDRGLEDGTEDLHVIYERLAIRDATWCKPRRSTEYQSMDGADMIKNLLLGSFASKTAMVEYYQTYWLPLERLSMIQSTVDDGNDDDENDVNSESSNTLQTLFEAFLAEEKSKQKNSNHDAATIATTGKGGSGRGGMVIGGRIYTDFERWMGRDFARWQQATASSNPEEYTRQLGRRLLEFANKQVNA